MGFASLAALVLGGVIIIIKNKDGTETKIEVPDGATVMVKDKGGKTLAKVEPGTTKPPATDSGADRKAAEWVIAQGGFVNVSGADKDIKTANDLPKERFTLTSVILMGAKVKVTNAGLERLKDLKGLVHLQLTGAAVTDAGLPHLKELKSLTILGLSHTAVADGGLPHLKELKSLTNLYLSNTKVTDAGLPHLKEIKSLVHLHLGSTAVTAKGLDVLATALPACEIVHNSGTVVPKK